MLFVFYCFGVFFMLVRYVFKILNILVFCWIFTQGFVKGAERTFTIKDIDTVWINGQSTEWRFVGAVNEKEYSHSFSDATYPILKILSLNHDANINSISIQAQYKKHDVIHDTFVSAVLQPQTLDDNIEFRNFYRPMEQRLVALIASINEDGHQNEKILDKCFEWKPENFAEGEDDEIKLVFSRSSKVFVTVEDAIDKYVKSDKFNGHHTNIIISYYFRDFQNDFKEYELCTFHHDIIEEKNKFENCFRVDSNGIIREVVSRKYRVDTEEFKKWKELNGLTSVIYEDYIIETLGDPIGLIPDNTQPAIDWSLRKYVVFSEANRVPPAQRPKANVVYIKNIKDHEYNLCKQYRYDCMQYEQPRNSSEAIFNRDAKQVTLYKPTSITIKERDHNTVQGGTLQQDKYYEIEGRPLEILGNNRFDKKIFKPLNEGADADSNKVMITATNMCPLYMHNKTESFDDWSKAMTPLLDLDPTGKHFRCYANEKYKILDLSKQDHVNAIEIIERWVKYDKPAFEELILDCSVGSIFRNLEALSIQGYVFDKVRLNNLDHGDTDDRANAQEKHAILVKIHQLLSSNPIKKIEILMQTSAPFRRARYNTLFMYPNPTDFFITHLNNWDLHDKNDEGRKKILDRTNGVKSIDSKIQDAGAGWPKMSDAIIECIQRNKETVESLVLDTANFTETQTSRMINLIRELTNLMYFSWHGAGWRFDNCPSAMITGDYMPVSLRLAHSLCALNNLKEVTVDLPMIAAVWWHFLDQTSAKKLQEVRVSGKINYIYKTSTDHSHWGNSPEDHIMYLDCLKEFGARNFTVTWNEKLYDLDMVRDIIWGEKLMSRLRACYPSNNMPSYSFG